MLPEKPVFVIKSHLSNEQIEILLNRGLIFGDHRGILTIETVDMSLIPDDIIAVLKQETHVHNLGIDRGN